MEAMKTVQMGESMPPLIEDDTSSKFRICFIVKSDSPLTNYS